MKSIDEMVEELLSIELIERNGKAALPDAAKEMIHSIAERCKDVPEEWKLNNKAEEYSEGLSPEDVYFDMLHKIVDAPTQIHMRMVPRMLIPIISRKLREEELDGREKSDKL